MRCYLTQGGNLLTFEPANRSRAVAVVNLQVKHALPPARMESGLLGDVLAWCRRQQPPMAESRFGKLAVNNFSLVNNLRKGRGSTKATAAKVRAFMARNERVPVPQKIDELVAAGSSTGDRAGTGQGQAPEGTRGAAAVVVEPANACPPAQALVRAIVQQDRRGSERATVKQDKPKPKNKFDDVNEAAEDFAARIAAASARRAEILRKPEPVDWNRVADAHARKAAETRPTLLARPLPVADSPEECRRCGIPGRKGCAHQLPFVPEPIAESPYTLGKRNSYGHFGARA